MSSFESRDPLVRKVLRNQIVIMDTLHTILEVVGSDFVQQNQMQKRALRDAREQTIKALDDDRD